jgi:hypothetical protein
LALGDGNRLPNVQQVVAERNEQSGSLGDAVEADWVVAAHPQSSATATALSTTEPGWPTVSSFPNSAHKPQAEAHRGRKDYVVGAMFWFTRKKFSGSYFSLTNRRRS